jgi:hypothetical protein
MTRWRFAVAVWLTMLGGATLVVSADGTDALRPLGADGKPLNLDFETGDLRDWTVEGEAFAGQPVEGDTVSERRKDMASQHQGRYWVGSWERHKDRATGTLTSAPFTVTQPWCSFLVGGGPYKSTCVELVRKLELSGYGVREVGVHHYRRLHGRSQFFRFRSLIRTFRELLSLHWRVVVVPRWELHRAWLFSSST